MDEENTIIPLEEDLNTKNIQNLIYTIRGKQVMLDSDVAMLYHYETKNINKAMKRNIDRFPKDFCFQLTLDEVKQMWFQNGTTSEKENLKYRSEKYLPYVYTEHGISMLSGILSQNCKLSKLDVDKFNKQYPSLKIANTNKFHDRFILIDNKELYHIGASLKDLGKKCFAISKFKDVEYIDKITAVVL